jgi:hypothetical protein
MKHFETLSHNGLVNKRLNMDWRIKIKFPTEAGVILPIIASRLALETTQWVPGVKATGAWSWSLAYVWWQGLDRESLYPFNGRKGMQRIVSRCSLPHHPAASWVRASQSLACRYLCTPVLCLCKTIPFCIIYTKFWEELIYLLSLSKSFTSIWSPWTWFKRHRHTIYT